MLDTITHSSIFSLVMILLGTFLLGYVFSRFYNKFINVSTRIIHNDPTNYKFLGHSLTAIIYIVGFSWAISEVQPLKSMANSLLAGAGILAVAVGFASQHALSNIISGIFIVIFKPYRMNDRLRINDKLVGVVEDITLRHTVLRDFENRHIIIPNSIISNEMLINFNYSDDKISKWIDFTVSFDADLDLAMRIMQEEAMRHPLLAEHRTAEEVEKGVPKVDVKVVGMGEYGVQLRAWAWSNNPNDAFEIACDLYKSIKERFDAEGIEIPTPYRTIVFKNDLHGKQANK
jgi:small conductance mechanosensitive channel